MPMLVDPARSQRLRGCVGRRNFSATRALACLSDAGDLGCVYVSRRGWSR
jgi:hypothetical protein